MQKALRITRCPELMTSHERPVDKWKFISIVFRSTNDPTRNRILFTVRWKSSWAVPWFNWKPRPEDHQETPLQDRFTNDRTLLINIHTYQYVHVLFLVPKKLIIYSCASSLCFWMIKPRRYFHQSSKRVITAVARDFDTYLVRLTRTVRRTPELANIPSAFFSSSFLPRSPFFVIVGPALSATFWLYR